jgi:hypothetical protein
MLGKRCHDVNGQTVCRRHIYGYELYSSFHKTRDEMDITRKSVELSDDEDSFLPLAQIQGGEKLRAILRMLARSNLSELCQWDIRTRCRATDSLCAAMPSPLCPCLSDLLCSKSCDTN